jgi:hypothetical protein
MIPYVDLERALARWKARKTGGGEGEVPMSEAMAETSSGLISIGDAEIEESNDAVHHGLDDEESPT